jgi:hypothetical protein
MEGSKEDKIREICETIFQKYNDPVIKEAFEILTK